MITSCRAWAGLLLVIGSSVRVDAAAARPHCFQATASANSSATRAVFAARRCQGGGVTWAPILSALVGRRGRVTPVEHPSADMTGSVSMLDGKTRFAIDEEGDAALFCADERTLMESVRADYTRLNKDPAQLRSVMAQVSPLEMECLDAQGGAPTLPPTAPTPALPADARASVHARLMRLRATLQREPSWCFADDDPQGRKGVLRFSADGHVTQALRDGTLIAIGVVKWPDEALGDDRLEIVTRSAPGVVGGVGLAHFDLGASGRLGETYADDKGTRRELTPGSVCLRSR